LKGNEREWELIAWEWEGMGMEKGNPAHLYYQTHGGNFITS